MDQARQTFIDRMGHYTEADGLSPIAGRLFAVLLLADEPYSLDELAETLGVSKASVSTDARRLLERGVVERVSRAGDRKDYYELAPRFYGEIIRSRVNRWKKLHQLIDEVRDGADDLPAAARERFASIDDVHTFVVDRIDAALVEWEQRSRKRAPARAPERTSTKSSRRRSA